MQAASEHLSRQADLNIIFTLYLVAPVGKRYYGALQRPGAFAANMEILWKQGVDTLATAFSHDIAEMVSIFPEYFDNPHQFGSVKNSYSKQSPQQRGVIENALNWEAITLDIHSAPS
jgi:hypothetical protein